MSKKLFAEGIGTMVLVLMGCGAAVFNGGCGTPAQVLMVSFAFGLAVVAMAYAIGGISGCHINPAITFGAWLTKRMSGKEAIGYVVAQCLGALVGSAIIYALVKSIPMDYVTTTGANSTSTVLGGFIAEVVVTFVFVLVVLGTTDSEKGAGNLAGLAIGLTLVLCHIVCIPITGTSVNPARSLAPALFEGGVALEQLWIFILAPLAGAALAAIVWRCLTTGCCHKK